MIIQIPQPCEQSWEEMQQTGKDCRFCASCQKTVTDFTGWTDNDIYHFYTKYPDACGQFTISQLDRELLPYYPPPQNRWSFRGWALTASLLFAAAPMAWANPQALEIVVDAEDTNTHAIKGKVLDDKGQVMIGAVIEISERGIVKAGAQVFEDDGSFIVKNVMAGKYSYKISFIGYEDCKGEVVVDERDANIGSVNLAVSDKPYIPNTVVVGYRPMMRPDTVKPYDTCKQPNNTQRNIRGKISRKPSRR